MVERRQGSESWHVGKEIPLALIFAMAMQTVGGVWFAATYVAKIDTLTSLMSEFKASQYTRADAVRDADVAMTRHQDVVRRVEVLEHSMTAGYDRKRAVQ